MAEKITRRSEPIELDADDVIDSKDWRVLCEKPAPGFSRAAVSPP